MRITIRSSQDSKLRSSECMLGAGAECSKGRKQMLGGDDDAEQNDWEAPFARSDGKSVGTRPILRSSNGAWDKSNASGLLRILTINMHGRPVDLAQANGALGMRLPGDDATSMIQCDDEYHLANAQERRIRGLFEWLDALPPEAQPHVLCLQEVVWRPMVLIAERELNRRGFLTWPAVSLMADDGCRTCMPPRGGSGLGVYVQRSAGLKVLDGGRMVFEQRIGTDWLIEKGLKWVAIEVPKGALSAGGGVMMVATMHPQAYNELQADSPPGESRLTSFIRGLALADVWWRGGYPGAVTATHASQYQQAAAYLKDTALKRTLAAAGTRQLLGVFLGGDLNVNRFAVAPNSLAEASAEQTASSGPSREYRAALQTLGCRQPTILRESSESLAPANDGLFTWDGGKTGSTVAAPLLCTQPPAFGWIDAILTCSPAGCRQPSYMDNRAVKLRLDRPCPELAPFWLAPCSRWRSRALADGSAGLRAPNYRAANSQCSQRLTQGRTQFFRLAQQFLRKARGVALATARDCLGLLTGRWPDLARSWSEFVQGAPEAQSSNLWKGLDFYGLRITDLYASPAARIPVGAPHAFRMLSDVSDHHGVLARIRLPSP
jgi:hypothetical protein